jgi:hypothetical protein
VIEAVIERHTGDADAVIAHKSRKSARSRDLIFFQIAPLKRTGMPEKLDAEAKRLRTISPGDLADAIGALEARVETAQRTDKPLLLKVLGITAPRLHPH